MSIAPRYFQLLHRAHAAVFARANRETMEQLGVTVPLLVILFQLQRGPMRSTELATAIDVDPAAITRLVDRLVAAKLVERVPDAEDGRARLVRIADAGRALVSRGRSLVVDANRGLTEPFSADELAVVVRFLEHAIAHGKASPS